MNTDQHSEKNLERGYELVDSVLTCEQLKQINSEIDEIEFPALSGGIRNAEKKFSSVRSLVELDQIKTLTTKYLSGAASLVRAVLFEKTAKKNWLVTWHQDRTVAVSEKFSKSGWERWSVKDGSHHVQPPLEVLNQMVTLRIHLDEMSQENGCLKLLPNSQQLGVLDHASIQEYVSSHKPELCEAPAGSALAMRPHILHSSSKASKPSRRRVLHLEYSNFQLPHGISWA